MRAWWIVLACACSSRPVAPAPAVVASAPHAVDPFVPHDRFPAAGALRAIWTIAPDDVWAVGERNTILHWDGRAWSIAIGDCRRCPPAFDAVWASGPRDVWVVGSTVSHVANGVISADNRVLHWDGREWANVPLPALGSHALQGVHGSGPDDVWFTAANGIHASSSTIALHWNGKRFAEHPIPNAGAVSWVTSLGKRNAWMLATHPAQREKPLLHWDGTAWTRDAAIIDPIALWESGGELWVATELDLRRRDRNGKWTVTPAVNRVHRVFRDRAPWAFGPNGMWRWVGTRFEQVATPNGFSVEAAGGEWMVGMVDRRRTAIRGTTVLANPMPGDVASPTFSAPDVGWAVGRASMMQPEPAELMRWNGREWRRAVVQPPFVPSAAWATTGGRVWVTGGGNLALGDGGPWTVMPAVGKGEFTTLFGLGPDDLWAAGCGGNLAHWDGTSWSKVPIDIPPEHAGTCLALGGVATDDLWGVAHGGVFRWNGREWRREPLDPALFATTSTDRAQPRAVWAAARDDVWIVGGASDVDAPLLLHFDGKRWTRIAIPPESVPVRLLNARLRDERPRVLYAVWGRGPRDIWVAGERGLVMHYNGTAWLRVATPPHDTRSLSSITGTADATWFAGERGALRSLARTATFELASAPPKLTCTTPPAPPASWWLRGDAACPPGAILDGAAPPNGDKVFCRRPFGDRHGPETTFDAGKPFTQSSYVDGEPMGVTTQWNGNGAVTSEIGRCGRTKHGPYRLRSERGQLLVDGRMIEGVPEGELRAWDANGRALGTSKVTNGTGRVTWWNEDGSKSSEGAYKDGKQHGEWTEYWSSDRPRERGTYRAGKREGRWTTWDAMGRVQTQVDYRDGEAK
jgi:antitoxin component YwqK of YwqJK toxin-antitoxin module